MKKILYMSNNKQYVELEMPDFLFDMFNNALNSSLVKINIKPMNKLRVEQAHMVIVDEIIKNK